MLYWRNPLIKFNVIHRFVHKVYVIRTCTISDASFKKFAYLNHISKVLIKIVNGKHRGLRNRRAAFTLLSSFFFITVSFALYYHLIV